MGSIFRFFGKIASGAAYAFGLCIGFALWALVRKLLKAGAYAGGFTVLLSQLGVDFGKAFGTGSFVNKVTTGFSSVWSSLVGLIS